MPYLKFSEKYAEDILNVPAGYKGRWVMQRHKATGDHIDFRLEVPSKETDLEAYKQKRETGKTPEPQSEASRTVLRSLVIPKPEKFLKKEKTLVVQSEDHPIKYLDFEGTIPKGSYGAGTMKIIDKGSYEVVSKVDNRYKLRLSGKDLNETITLIRIDDNHWIILRGTEDMEKESKWVFASQDFEDYALNSKVNDYLCEDLFDQF